MDDIHGLADEARQIRDRLDGLGLTGMVDIHTHFLPDQVMAKVWAYFDQAGPLTGRAWPINYRFDQQTRLEVLRSLGVVAFTSLVYPHKPGMAAWLNQWATDFAAATPDCVHSATFFAEDCATADVTTAIDAGAQVFKAHVQVGGYDPNDPLLDQVWDILTATGTPVVIHSGHGPVPGAFTGPDTMRALLARFPGLVLVVAHMGMPDYAEFLDLADRYAGVHLDTTMVFTDFTEAATPFPTDLRGRLADLGDKVVFGSDFPNIPYPYLHAVDSVLALDLGAEWNRAVLAGNARRLLGL